MMLRRRAVLTSLLVAIPATGLLGYVAERIRTADMELALERVVRSQINEQVRERCESDPGWFLTGPLEGRPRNGVFVETNPEALPPRPKNTPQPFELFAYDEQFVGSSSGSARFPPDFRRSLRASPQPVRAAYVTDNGTGTQIAMPTGWIGSTCMFFLGRMAPPPNQMRHRLVTLAGLFGVSFLVAWLATAETISRVRKLAREERESASAGYTAIAPDEMKDELSSLAFVFNDAATELHQRKTRIDDQETALRRFVQAADEDIAKPLAALTATLGTAVTGHGSSREDLHVSLRRAHDLSAHIENLTAAARLRMTGSATPTARIDVNALVTGVIARHMPVAQASGVDLHLSLPPVTVVIEGDASLVERAVSNVVDNGVRYNRPGGEVKVTLSLDDGGKEFRLRVADNGPGVSEEDFRGLTAIRRFRGDEGRNRRPGAPGLGLAVAREVADRFKLQLELKRPPSGGFEVEFSGAV